MYSYWKYFYNHHIMSDYFINRESLNIICNMAYRYIDLFLSDQSRNISLEDNPLMESLRTMEMDILLYQEDCASIKQNHLIQLCQDHPLPPELMQARDNLLP